MKVFVASFHRASDGALSKLIKKMKEKDMWTDGYKNADYILAVGDRVETHTFVLERFKENKKIIHLFAGEQANWNTHDDLFRSSITLMSDLQMCINGSAFNRVIRLCRSVDKKPNACIVGNVYLDGLELEDVKTKWSEFDVVLYNPLSRLYDDEIKAEIKEIIEMLGQDYYWISPNGDRGSDLVEPYVNTKILSRPVFLGLLKKCRRFITNSSCQYFEAPFIMDKKKIISIGKRNRERESKYSDMTIKGASDKIIKILEGLK